ncbi:hypothetical protein MIDIC_460025 [Alphaproteobacteria bacterium]
MPDMFLNTNHTIDQLGNNGITDAYESGNSLSPSYDNMYSCEDVEKNYPGYACAKITDFACFNEHQPDTKYCAVIIALNRADWGDVRSNTIINLLGNVVDKVMHDCPHDGSTYYNPYKQRDISVSCKVGGSTSFLHWFNKDSNISLDQCYVDKIQAYYPKFCYDAGNLPQPQPQKSESSSDSTPWWHYVLYSVGGIILLCAVKKYSEEGPAAGTVLYRSW